jgi:ATP-dependent DNA helicase RecQ
MARATASIERVARDALGLESLRPGQREAIEAVVAGRDVLAVMATGYGKSAIYQVAGIERPGVTVVVSPLLALQQDQVEGLEQTNAPLAAVLNATLAERDRGAVLNRVRDGRIEFVLLAPEQLQRNDTIEALREAKPSLLVIDEAHCVSTMGHDFRPDYLFIGAAVRALGHPPVLALTATASPIVRDEISGSLGLRDPLVLVRGFDRPELHLGVRSFADADTRDVAIVDALAEELPRPAIAYARTRAQTEQLEKALTGRGIAATSYHGGLAAPDRRERQRAFMNGEAAVIVATNAFGMGVDKSDVRAVAHVGMPPSLDAYFQEIGRAARDGEPGEGVLFHAPGDASRQVFLAAAPIADRALLATVLGAVPVRGAVDVASVAELAQTPPGRAWRVLGLLASAGLVETSPPDSVRRTSDSGASLDDAVALAEARRELQRSRLAMMRTYAETETCRRAFLLGYFGEPFDPPCRNCDLCDQGVGDIAPGPYASGVRVRHQEWGEGTVMRSTEESVLVEFPTVGYRRLATGLVVEKGLLKPLP